MTWIIHDTCTVCFSSGIFWSIRCGIWTVVKTNRSVVSPWSLQLSHFSIKKVVCLCVFACAFFSIWLLLLQVGPVRFIFFFRTLVSDFKIFPVELDKKFADVKFCILFTTSGDIIYSLLKHSYVQWNKILKTLFF